MVSQLLDVTAIRLSVILAVVIIRQIYALTTDVDQQCQQLVKELSINDITTANSLKHSCESLRDYDTVNKAHIACSLASLAFGSKPFGTNDFAGYIDLQSPSYLNLTKSNW